jgi:hypothetical protein
MRLLVVCTSILIAGCVTVEKPTIEDTKCTRSPEYQEEIDVLLALDADNKRWEVTYLREIAAAQQNDDYEAYRFFLSEFIKIPRLKLPEWMKSESGYIPSIISVDDLTE